MVLKLSIIIALLLCVISCTLAKKQPDTGDKGKIVARQSSGDTTGDSSVTHDVGATLNDLTGDVDKIIKDA
ncbi:uncharacterized protein BX664DRAFT_330257 [Halteromyces radiatus]|uniref:uncharacterized protein n=1 Tax=Halteromyces radiatus TaxID=101107 RepID=UPI00221FCF70|nr:uncharacterized protein BX664DRAFT_330257 [Halteromyces radiatus]KAI8093658.1 hypothetical protein BX664DRAFT_330257 [Halteromyces radiatus]